MYHLDDDEIAKPNGPHVAAQEHYYEMRKRYEVADRKAKVARSAMVDAKRAMIETMMDMGLSRLDYMDDGSSINFRGGMNISVTKENEAEVREWLCGNYGDDTEFEDVKLNKKAIRDRIKEDIDAGELAEVEVPKCLKLSTFPDIQVRGWVEP